MSQGKPDIGIVYIKNTFEPCELNEVTTELEEYGLKLMTHEKLPYINASIDFFVPFLQILVSPEIVSAFSQGLLNSATYDGIKALLKRIYRKFHAKSVSKIQNGNIIEESTNIHFVVGNNHIVLPIDVDKEKFEYVVDQFMLATARCTHIEPTYTFYSEKDDAVLSKTETEIIQEEYEKQQKEKNQDE